MENCRGGIGKFVGVCLIVLTVLGSQGVRAAEPQPEQPAPPQATVEAVPEEKPPEKPPEVPAGYIPGGIPSAPYTGWQYAPYYTTTFHPGPTTGILAPYGYGVTDDTLIRGWQSHGLGPVRVSPYLEYDGLFRTNVFQTTGDKKSDYVNTINPGIRFELPVADKSKLSLGYLGEAFIFSRYGELSHFDQNVNADAALNFSELSIKTGTAFRAATEEPTILSTPPFGISRQRFYDRTTPYFQAAYTMADRWRVVANYQFDDLTWAKSIDRQDNYQYNTFGGTIFYKFLPKTSALLQYSAVIRTYPFNSPQDSVVHTPMAGLTWDPTAKLSGTVKFGYTISDFNHPLPGTSKSTEGFAMSLQTLYHISRFTQLSLVAQRALIADVDYADQAYYNTGFLLSLTHFWHYFNITSYAAFSYYNNNYVVKTIDPVTGQLLRRNENNYSFGAGVSRPITRWLRVRLDYLYGDRGSNFTFYTYNEHRLIIGLQTSF